VTLRADGRTVAVGRSYSSGLAVISGAAIPARFELRTTGGWIGKRRFSGHLVVSVTGYRRGSTVVIDPATTLSTRLCRDLGSNSVRRCDARVRAFLDLPRGTDLGEGLASDSLFDGRRFLHIARRHGGVAPFLVDLERRLLRDRRGHYGFRHGQSGHSVHRHSPATGSRRGRGIGGPSASDWIGLVTGVAGNLEDPVGLVGTVLGFIAGQDQSDELDQTLRSMQAELTDIQGQLAGLQAEVSALPGIIDQDSYSNLAGQAAPEVNAIHDAQSSFLAVLDNAVEIGCGEFTASPSQPPVACADPKSPAEVCTAAAEAADASLKSACITFGDLPLPAGAQEFYTINAPAAAQTSLIGEFINEIQQGNKLDDADLEGLANQLGGKLGGGSGPALGLMQLAARHYATGPWFTTADSQALLNTYDYYYNALLSGATMRIAYYAFDGIPSTTYTSPVQTTLDDLRQLNVAAPQPLPAGTFIATSSYSMWSDQIGAIDDQAQYLSQVKLGATLTLPTANSNEPASATSNPQILTLPNGSPASNWSVAQFSDLKALYGHLSLTAGQTPGDYLTESLADSKDDAPGVWPGLLSNGVWDAPGYQTPDHQAVESPDERGLSFVGVVSDSHSSAIPHLELTPCKPAGNPACPEPTWATGTGSGVYDLNNGQEPPAPQEIGPKTLEAFVNWSRDNGNCGGYHPYCLHTFPQIVGFLRLPVLFERTPADDATECYYWPASGEPTAGNGCPS
jgi:hypothetical protein